MARGQFGGEVTIYGHDEVISLLKQMAEMLLTPKETKFIGDKVHLEEVKDGEDRTILGHRVTFLIFCLQRQNSLVLHGVRRGKEADLLWR